MQECMKNDAGYDCAQAFAIWSLSFKSIRSPHDSVNYKTESHTSVSSYEEWRSAFFPKRFRLTTTKESSHKGLDYKVYNRKFTYHSITQTKSKNVRNFIVLHKLVVQWLQEQHIYTLVNSTNYVRISVFYFCKNMFF